VQGPADRQAGGLAHQVVTGLVGELVISQSNLDVGDLHTRNGGRGTRT
jgi:hypothetical protein